jgi:hypothetical protein
MSSSFYKKDLIYPNFDAFIKEAEESFDFSKLNFGNPKICNSLLNLFDKGNDFLKLDDDEKAFIYLFRFVQGVLKLRQSKFYKEDKSYVDGFIPSDKVKNAMTKLENLKLDIKARYVEREKKLLDEMKALEDKAKKDSNVNTINGNEASLTMKTSLNSKELIEFLNKPLQKILIVDLRSSNEFNSSHLNLSLALNDARKKESLNIDYINIPSELVETVAWKMSESLKRHDMEVSKIFESRQSYDYLILFDTNSGKFSLKFF